MDTLPGDAIVYFHVCLPSQKGLTLTEKNLFLQEQILSFESRPHFSRTSLSRKAHRKSQKLFPFVIIVRKTW